MFVWRDHRAVWVPPAGETRDPRGEGWMRGVCGADAREGTVMAKVVLHSSVLTDADYHAEEAVLLLTFRSGKTYTYYGVPLRVYRELLLAPSAGKYFAAHIRGKYQAPPPQKD